MPSRTGGGYTTPVLTPEEEAALAAEQAAAAPPPEQTVMYQPASPPPADVAPVAAPVEQTTMYQPSSPPPAAAPAPAAEPYTSISPQVTDTSNPSVEPGYSAPASERYDDATAINTAYQPAPMWSSISPQDSGNAAKSAYPVSVSDFRDPLKTPEATMAQNTRYQPSMPQDEPKGTTRQTAMPKPGVAAGLSSPYAGERPPVATTADPHPSRSGEGLTDVLGRTFGLDPNDPTTDMANQLGQNYAHWWNDRLWDVGKTVNLADNIPSLIDNQLTGAKKLLVDPLLKAGEFAQSPLAQTLRSQWGVAEDVLGPIVGNQIRVGQSNLDAPGAELDKGREALGTALASGYRDPAGSIKDTILDGPTKWWQAGPGAWSDKTFHDERAKHDAGVGAAPDSKIEAGAQTLSDLEDFVQRASGVSDESIQKGKGAAIGARLNGGSPLDAALAAARPIAQDVRLAVPDVDSRSLRSLYAPSNPDYNWDAAEPNTTSDYAIDKNGMVLGEQRLYRPPADSQNLDPSNPLNADEQWNKEVGAARNGIPYDLLRAEYDPASTAYVPQEPAFPATLPETGSGLMDRARDAATQAKNWAADQGIPLPGSAARPTMYQPSSPPVSLRDRATGALDTARNLLPEVDVPSITIPGRSSLPNGGESFDGPDLTFLQERSSRPEMYQPSSPPQGILDRARDAGNSVVQGISDRINPPADPSIFPDNPVWDGDTIRSAPSLLDQARGAISNLIPDSMPNITIPGRGTPASGGPGTGGSSAGAIPATNAAATANATRLAAQPEGTSVADKNGVTWVKGPNGDDDYRGLVDPATGEYVMFPEGSTPEQIEAIISGVVSPKAAASSAPGPATSATGTGTPDTSSNASTTTSTKSSSNSGGGGGGGKTTYYDDGDNYTPKSSSKSSRSTYSNDDDYDSAPLKLEDFLQDFDGDGTIGKRDRMQGKQAFEQAKMARSKKMRGKKGSITQRKGTTNQFPFNRPDSAIRTQVLGAIAESQGKKG